MKIFRPSRPGLITACTIANVVSMTPIVHATFGTFLLPLTQAFGWSRASISGVLGLLSVITAVLTPLVGHIIDRYGTRRLVLAGNLLLAAGMALLAFSNGSLLRFYLNFALIAGAAALASTSVVSKTVSDWFTDNRGAMLGVSAGLGNGVGATVMPIFVALLLQAFGWREAYLGLGLLVAMLGFPILYLYLHDRTDHKGAPGQPFVAQNGATLVEAMRTRQFWLIFVAIASGAGCMTAVFGHVIPILAERKIDLGSATAVLSVFAAICALWQISIGFVLDRVSTPRIVAPLYIAPIAGLFLLESAETLPILLLAGALLGIGLGTQFGALPYFLGRYFGMRRFGVILGMMYSGVVIMQGLVPILLDHAYDIQGTYAHALSAGLALLALDAALVLLLPAYRQDMLGVSTA
jgi:MFS family permease